MSEGDPLSFEEQFNIRIGEMMGRTRIQRSLVLKRMEATLTNLLAQPNAENFNQAFDQIFNAGEESGQLLADNAWLRSLKQAGLPLEVIMIVWNLKDDATREMKENLQGPSQ